MCNAPVAGFVDEHLKTPHMREWQGKLGDLAEGGVEITLLDDQHPGFRDGGPLGAPLAGHARPRDGPPPAGTSRRPAKDLR